MRYSSFDYRSACVKKASKAHLRDRFETLYEPESHISAKSEVMNVAAEAMVTMIEEQTAQNEYQPSYHTTFIDDLLGWCG